MPLIALTAALGPATVSFAAASSTHFFPINSRSQCSWKAAVRGKQLQFPSNSIAVAEAGSGRFEVRAFFPNPSQQPIFKEALKEPVAFVGGIFAGLLRLDLNEEPLREWVARTVEASGVRAEEEEEEEEEEVAQQIEIE